MRHDERRAPRALSAKVLRLDERRQRKGAPAQPLYPLERVCTRLGEADQELFAREAVALLRDRTELQAEATSRGVVLAAETEEIMEAAVASLAARFGATLRVGPPNVRLQRRLGLEQPWMGLRARVPAVRAGAVERELRAREARIVACEPGGEGAVILRAFAPLRRLLGFGAALAVLTAGTGRHESWLSHYEPLEPPPGGDAA